MYFRARYYSPQLGQFISRDPLGYVDGMSQYRAYFVPGGMDPSGEVCFELKCEEDEIHKNGIIVSETPIKVRSTGGVLGLIRERAGVGFGDFSELRKKVQASLEKKYESRIDMASDPAIPRGADGRICCFHTIRRHFWRLEDKTVTVTDKRKKLKVTFEYIVATWYESRSGEFVWPEDCPENRRAVNVEEIWDLSELIPEYFFDVPKNLGLSSVGI